MYYLWFVTCDEDLAAVTVDGATEWKNPTGARATRGATAARARAGHPAHPRPSFSSGFLPGAMIPYVRFFAVATAAYALLAVVWAAASARSWADVGPLQHAIAAVIALGLIEQAMWFGDYAHFNRVGHRPAATTLAAVAVGCARRTLCRGVALAVAMGTGAVTPSLGAAKGKLAALCGTYMVAASALGALTSVGQVDDLTGGARALLGLPVAALDAVCVLWLFSSLSKTLATVAARRAAAKLDLYRRFTNALAVMVWASIAFTAYETYAKVTDPFAARWRLEWVHTAFWVALDAAFTAAVALLFRPCPAAARFAYSEADAESGYSTLEKGGSGIAALGGGKAPLPALEVDGGGKRE